MTSNVANIPTQVPRAAPATFKQALFVAVTAGLGYGFDSYAVNIYGLVLPDIKRTLHITDAEAGYIGSIFLLGYTIGTIGFGFAADRWGRKTTLGASILLYGVTTALAGLTTNIAAFTGLRFLTGVGGAGELAVGAPYTAEVWPAKTRALGVGGVIFSLICVGDPRKGGSVWLFHFVVRSHFRSVLRAVDRKSGSRWSARSTARTNDLDADEDPPHTWVGAKLMAKMLRFKSCEASASAQGRREQSVACRRPALSVLGTPVKVDPLVVSSLFDLTSAPC